MDKFFTDEHKGSIWTCPACAGIRIAFFCMCAAFAFILLVLV